MVQNTTDIGDVPRAGGRTPRTPRPGGGLTHAQGPHVAYEKIFFLVFNVFKIFVKIFVHNDIYR